MVQQRSSASGLPPANGKRSAAVAKRTAKGVPLGKANTANMNAKKSAVARSGSLEGGAPLVAQTTVQKAVKSEHVRFPLDENKPAMLSYVGVYKATPLERIRMIRQGVAASEAKRMFSELLIGQGAAFKALNLSTATINKKAKQGETLSPDESERVVGFASLVGQLEAMIQDSGDLAGFNPHAWMARWLTEPLPAFGGARPADLVDTMEGQRLVSSALAQIQSGAYA